MLFPQMSLPHASLTRDKDINNMNELKFERVASYIKEQRPYTHIYHSPNHLTASDDSSNAANIRPSAFKPDIRTQGKKSTIHRAEEEYHDEDFSLFSASISQVIARNHRREQEKLTLTSIPSEIRLLTPRDKKGHKSCEHRSNYGLSTQSNENQPSPNAHYNHQKKPRTISHKRSNNVLHHHRKSSSIKSSDGSISHCDKRMKLPHTKANGFHLLHKFISPNLEANRITIKHQDANRRPKLGLFNKGKSSSKATRAVPDLVFSESKFLEKANIDVQEHVSITNVNVNDEKQNYVSKYFKSKTQHIDNENTLKGNIQNQDYSSSTRQHYHEFSDNNSRSIISPKRDPLHTINQKKRYTLYSPLSRLHSCLAYNNESMKADVRGDISTTWINHQDKNLSLIENSEKLSTKKVANTNDISLSSSSNNTIKRILKECKETPQETLFNQKHQNYDQCYSNEHQCEQLNNNNNNDSFGRKPNYIYSIDQIPSYSIVKSPISEAIKSFLNRSIRNQSFGKEPILIESSSDDNGISRISSNHIAIEEDEDNNRPMYSNTTPTSPISNNDEEEDTLQLHRTNLYEDNSEDIYLGLDTHSSQPFESYYNNISNKLYDDGPIEEWQIENSFSDEDKSISTDPNEFNKDDTILPLQFKNKRNQNVDSIVNFWKNQFRRSL